MKKNRNHPQRGTFQSSGSPIKHYVPDHFGDMPRGKILMIVEPPDPLKVFINVPEWFKVGIKFSGKWINDGDNVCTVLSFDKEKNIAEVNIATGGTNWTEDNWNLQHTLWGFESSHKDYTLIP